MRRPILLRVEVRAACLALALLATPAFASGPVADRVEIDAPSEDATEARLRAAEHVGRGVALAASGQIDNAIDAYTTALETSPDFALALYDRANAFRLRYQRARSLATEADDGASDQERALADYTRAIELKPDFAAAYVNRAIVWYERGEFERAIADCDTAIRLAPNLAEAWNNRSLAWYRSGHYEKAKADFDQTIKLEQHYGNAMIMRALPDLENLLGSV